jgi:cytoskeleton protein RodZ
LIEVHLMNEDVSLAPAREELPVAPISVMTAGSILRRARENSGLHIAALAVSMKVPVKKLEALEADRLDLLPDPVFVRALASSVCRALKMDPATVLARLPAGTPPKLIAEQSGINAPFRAGGESRQWSIPDFFFKPAALAVMALVLAALAVIFYPEGNLGDALHQGDSQRSTLASVSEPTGSPLQVAAGPLVESSPTPEQKPLARAATADGVARVVSGGHLADVASTNTTAALVTFRARGPSWVQVTDAKGVVMANKTLTAGEVFSVPGNGPVAVVVGRVDVTDVDIRGSAFDLVGVARENVARFEVK